MPASFRPRQRLRTRAEFDQVFRRGVRLDGALFALIAVRNGRNEHRLGLVVSRRVGGAVARNRARRLLRESFRRLPPVPDDALDLVILVKAGLCARRQPEVEIELQQRLRRLARGSGPRGPRPAPRG